MEHPLKDKVVCVTGSARRVGRAIALGFAREGANVVIHHHSSDEEAESAAEEALSLGVDAFIVKANQADPADVARMFEEIQARYGRLDVMVNSAANYKKSPLLEINYDEWQSVLGVNLTGPFLCTQHAGRLMVESGNSGVIINISDNSGLKPNKARPHHSIAKSGIIMLTRVSALALGEHNIRVNCVVPGPVLQGQESDEHWEQLAERLPIGRTGHPDYVAAACRFLVTNDFATGAILHVDGGEGLV
jgi:NAD(P)-dependent dehydrogenase (short-subunit alcohol dehydrogenase family)